MYEYSAEIIKHVDGDSIWMRVDCGFKMHFEDNFRLLGINAPEVRGEEKEEGIKSAEALAELLPLGTSVRIETTKPGKYGRWLCTIFLSRENEEELNVNQYMLDEGFAKEYK